MKCLIEQVKEWLAFGGSTCHRDSSFRAWGCAMKCSGNRLWSARNGGTCLYSRHSGGRGRWISVNLEPVWSTYQVPDQSILHSETLSSVNQSINVCLLVTFQRQFQRKIQLRYLLEVKVQIFTTSFLLGGTVSLHMGGTGNRPALVQIRINRQLSGSFHSSTLTLGLANSFK